MICSNHYHHHWKHFKSFFLLYSRSHEQILMVLYSGNVAEGFRTLECFWSLLKLWFYLFFTCVCECEKGKFEIFILKLILVSLLCIYCSVSVLRKLAPRYLRCQMFSYWLGSGSEFLKRMVQLCKTCETEWTSVHLIFTCPSPNHELASFETAKKEFVISF